MLDLFFFAGSFPRHGAAPIRCKVQAMFRSLTKQLPLFFFVSLFALGCATGETNGNGDALPQGDKTVLLDMGTDHSRPDGARDVGVTPDTTIDMRWPDGPRPDGQADGPAVVTDTTVDSVTSDSTVDQGPTPDSTVDMGVPTTNIGTPCSDSSTCTGGSECLLSIGGVGLCTIADCTRDDPSTTGQNEDSCPDPAYNICGDVTLTTGSRNFCLKRCRPRSDGNDCPGAFACDPESGFTTGQLGVAVCTSLACSGGSDCPVFTGGTCDSSNLTGCNAGEVCKVYDNQGYCALPGSCNGISGLCEGHIQGTSAAVGAPCTDDVDCGTNMFCLAEMTLTGGEVLWRQGYCTISACEFADTVAAYACPSGSSCNRSYSGWHGLCQKSCDLTQASDCRGESGDFYGDYDCYSWNTFTIGGAPVSGTPVCDTPVPCDFLTSGCPALGAPGNQTTMVCRNLQGNVLANGVDPSGYCLDTSTSGPTQ